MGYIVVGDLGFLFIKMPYKILLVRISRYFKICVTTYSGRADEHANQVSIGEMRFIGKVTI